MKGKLIMGLDEKILTDAMTSRCKWLEKFIEMRNYDIGYNNSNFLCIYFCALCIAYNRQDAKRKLREMNKKLKNCLSKDSIENMIKNINKYNLYKYPNETIIQRLSITEDEVKELGIYKHQENVKKRKENKIKKENLREAILADYEKNLNRKEIVEKYCNDGQINARTVDRWLKEAAAEKKEKRNNEIIRLRESGATYEQIKEICDCGINTIKRVLFDSPKLTKKTDIVQTMIVKESYQSKSDLGLKALSLYKSEVKTSSVTDYQLALLKLKGTKNNVYIYGHAGTGKTHLVKEWLKSFTQEELQQTLVLAPTGKSSELLNGNTIHSVFKFPLGVLPKPDINNMVIPTGIENIKRIIIDECSLVRVDIFENLIQTIRLIEKTYKRKIQIVCISDYGQIEPTVMNREKNLLKQYYQNKIYAFQSELWEQCNFEKIKLIHVFRQQDPVFSEYLIRLKYGDNEAIDFFNRHSAYTLNEKAIYITSLRTDANKYNRMAVSKFKASELKTYKAKCKEIIEDEELPTEEEITLAVGMRVLATCNDADGLYKNGSLGTVVQLNKNSVDVQLDNGSVVNVRYKVFILESGAVWMMLPLAYGYAITVQKSQGCTFEYVAIDGGENGFFAVGSLYVALSRCTDIRGLFLIRGLRKKELKVNTDALQMTL